MRTITAIQQHTKQDRTDGHANDGAPIPQPGCVWWPGSSSEELDRRDEVTMQSTLSVPYGVDVRATDEFTLPDGRVWLVNGVSEPYQSPFTGWSPGQIVHLQRSEG